MKSQNTQDVYVTFKTHPLTCSLLKTIAHKMGKTQPELINEICEGYIENVLSTLEEKGFLNNFGEE